MEFIENLITAENTRFNERSETRARSFVEAETQERNRCFWCSTSNGSGRLLRRLPRGVMKEICPRA